MSFALDLQKFAESTSAKVDAVVRKVVLDVSGALAFKSPVGDPELWVYKHPELGYVNYLAYKDPPPGYVGGRFRANWQYGLDKINFTTTEEIKPNKQPDYEANAADIGILEEVPKKAGGHMHYITNSLPYAKRLEEGWSTQAPAGMVRLTVGEFQPIVEEAARLLANER